MAAKIGVNVGTLDNERKKRRPPTVIEGEKNLAGCALSLPVPEPWSDPVDGAELLDAITKAITGYVVMPFASAVSAALWCVHAHAFEASYISPRLAITSPEKRCGKTTLLRVMQELVSKPLPAANITAAALFRTVEAVRPSLLIDEADTFLGENEELRGIINSGHASDGQVIRLVGDGFEPRAFSTWCPTAIAAIGSLPGTIEDRSILIAMRRRRADEPVARFRPDQVGHLHELRRKIARWVADNALALRDADPAVPSELHDRAADNWRPLLTIADVAGGQWPERARAAALTQSAERLLEEDSLTIMLLSDIRDTFAARKTDWLSSEKLVGNLVSQQDRPWTNLNHGKGLSPARLARMLKCRSFY